MVLRSSTNSELDINEHYDRTDAASAEVVAAVRWPCRQRCLTFRACTAQGTSDGQCYEANGQCVMPRVKVPSKDLRSL